MTPPRPRRDVALLAAAQAVTQFGSMLTLIAVSLHLRPAGPGWVAAAMAAELLPIVLLAPVAGLAVDRLPGRPLLVGAYAVEAVAVTALSLGAGARWPTLALLGVLGTAMALAGPAASALVPRAAGEDGATRAYAQLATARTLGFLAGLAGSGFLVDAVGTGGALRVDAATYVAQGLLVLAVRARRTPSAHGRGAGAWSAQLSAGARVLGADPLLRIGVAGLALGVLASTVVNVASVFLVVGRLHSGPLLYGFVEASWAVGAVAGSWAAGRLDGAARVATALLAGGVVMGVALAGAGALASLAGTVAAWLVAGAANGVQNVAVQALVRLRVPDAVRGRAFAASGAVFQAANVVSLLAGALIVAALGPAGTLVVGGAATALVSLAALGVLRRALRPVPLRVATPSSAAPPP